MRRESMSRQVRQDITSALCLAVIILLQLACTAYAAETKYWLVAEANADMAQVRTSIVANQGVPLELTPEGRILIELPPDQEAALLNEPTIASLSPVGTSLALAGAQAESQLPDFFGQREPTEEEQAFIDSVATKDPSVAPNALSSSRAAITGLAGARPAAVDNSASVHFPPIGNQGGQGSCTAWAAGYYYNTYTQALDENLTVSDGNNAHICSPAFLYPLVNQGVDEGSSVGVVMARQTRVGCASWELMPYTSSMDMAWPPEEAWVEALKRRTDGLTVIGAYGCTDQQLETIKQHLANGNVAATKTHVYNNWYQSYPAGTGIDNEVLYAVSDGDAGGHALCIVGYDDNKTYFDGTQTQQGAFLIANSWGTGWGVENTVGTSRGFLWVGYELFKEVGYSFGTAYWSADRDDYRPALYATAGLAHSQRGYVTYGGGVGAPSSPDWVAPTPIDNDGGTMWSIDASKPVAVDLTDGLPYIGNPAAAQLYVEFTLDASASGNGTLSSAEFYEDLDGDGTYNMTPSADPPLTVTPGTWVAATVELGATLPLSVYMSSDFSDPTNQKPIPVTVTFTAPVTGFDASDIQRVNASVDNFQGSGASYSFVLWPWGDGIVEATIPAGAATDGMGASNEHAASFTRAYDGTPPELLLGDPSVSLTGVGPITYSLGVSEGVSMQFKTSSISLVCTGTAQGTLNITEETPDEWVLTVNNARGDGTVSIIIEAGAIEDPAGNPCSEVISASVTVDSSLDSDGDRLTDQDEVFGTYYWTSDPYLADSDGDGFDDWEEVQADRDPMAAHLYPGVPVSSIKVPFFGDGK